MLSGEKKSAIPTISLCECFLLYMRLCLCCPPQGKRFRNYLLFLFDPATAEVCASGCATLYPLLEKHSLVPAGATAALSAAAARSGLRFADCGGVRSAAAVCGGCCCLCGGFLRQPAITLCSSSLSLATRVYLGEHVVYLLL
jgi:hypothetical protein